MPLGCTDPVGDITSILERKGKINFLKLLDDPLFCPLNNLSPPKHSHKLPQTLPTDDRPLDLKYNASDVHSSKTSAHTATPVTHTPSQLSLVLPTLTKNTYDRKMGKETKHSSSTLNSFRPPLSEDMRNKLLKGNKMYEHTRTRFEELYCEELAARCQKQATEETLSSDVDKAFSKLQHQQQQSEDMASTCLPWSPDRSEDEAFDTLNNNSSLASQITDENIQTLAAILVDELCAIANTNRTAPDDASRLSSADLQTLSTYVPLFLTTLSRVYKLTTSEAAVGVVLTLRLYSKTRALSRMRFSRQAEPRAVIQTPP
ncbi:hypothetical protein BLNAU_9379 [Blattamonas nauphoetae]|uniref:Uncharacterized protein n=1 Tax=Blattamonas nauphoetae TaxID=2049346 RepID=A0ABQ9XW39_9EUKA|nr:hypothetical protein BLNAU_9379 [Blattamonas nauphoetae]